MYLEIPKEDLGSKMNFSIADLQFVSCMLILRAYNVLGNTIGSLLS